MLIITICNRHRKR